MIPNQSTIDRANDFYFKHLNSADKNLEIDLDVDVLGGVALIVYGATFYIWMSFMDNNDDSMVINDKDNITSYPINNTSISLLKSYTNDSNNISFICDLFQKIKSFFT